MSFFFFFFFFSSRRRHTRSYGDWSSDVCSSDLELLGGGSRERAVVVVVEDDPGYLKALVRTLQREAPDLDIIEATTAVDALLEIGRVSPDLVILVYALPDLNAVQVVE